MSAKSYIFPDGKYDPSTVPTPWFDYLRGKTEEEKRLAWAEGLKSGMDWVADNVERLDDEDLRYCFHLFYLSGTPMLRHESLNLLLLVMEAYKQPK